LFCSVGDPTIVLLDDCFDAFCFQEEICRPLAFCAKFWTEGVNVVILQHPVRCLAICRILDSYSPVTYNAQIWHTTIFVNIFVKIVSEWELIMQEIVLFGCVVERMD
jgi:hypothetical protein